MRDQPANFALPAPQTFDARAVTGASPTCGSAFRVVPTPGPATIHPETGNPQNAAIAVSPGCHVPVDLTRNRA